MPGGAIAIVLLLAILVAGIVALMRIQADDSFRRRVLDSGAPADVVRELSAFRARDTARGIRTGIVLLATGAMLVLLQFLPFGAGDPIAYGLILIAGGAALLIHHVWIERALGSGRNEREL